MSLKIQPPRHDCGNLYQLRVIKDFGPFSTIAVLEGGWMDITQIRNEMIGQGVDPKNIQIRVDADN